MNKKQIIVAWGIVILLLSGCVTMKEVDLDGDKKLSWYEVQLHNLENNPRGDAYVSDMTLDYPYKEVYLASLDIVRDWGVNIIFRDYDKGVIFVRPTLEFPIENSKNLSAPGRECGLFFQKINDMKTKVTLKAVRRFPLYSATAEDIFKSIEKEIRFRRKINE
ncbi:MAG: hypothetical protein ABIA97_06890 [Candidatus Omnitrophota bacterium]